MGYRLWELRGFDRGSGTRRSRLRGAFLLVLALVGATGFLACPSGEARDPNILLIVLDTTRRDHCSVYGYERDTTPRLREFAAQGVRFDMAYSAMATTAPTVATIFTSWYPVAHRLLKNGLSLREDHLTLAEFLGEKGFETAAILSSFVLDARFGFGQGFSFYDDKFDGTESVWTPKAWEGHNFDPKESIWNSKVWVGRGFDRRADHTTRRAIRWLRKRRDPDRPFFLFVHYFDPHLPYKPPEDFRSRFGPTHVNQDGGSTLEDSIRLYDGEIAFTDQEVGRLLDALRKLDLEEDTLVVIAADHGEGLLDHGTLSHGTDVYEEAVRVPLLARWPGHLPSDRTLYGPVELVDLAPTIFDLTDVEMDGWTTHGRSLAAALRGEASLEPDRPVYLHRRHFDGTMFGIVNKTWVKGELFGVRHGNWKYIVGDEVGVRELFNLETDPRERINVVLDEPETAARLASELEQWKRNYGSAEPVLHNVSEEDIELLESMGYVQ